MPRYILINRIYSGAYLKDRLGHEAINLVADDRGRQWCYINPNGLLPADKRGKVDWVINTILIRRGVFEVLNVFNVRDGELMRYVRTTQGTKEPLLDDHREFLIKQGIKYGGVAFHDIFEPDSVITFKANDVYVPRKRIVLTHMDLTGDPLNEDAIHLHMEGLNDAEEKQLGTQSARTYVRDTDQAYADLIAAINDQSLLRKRYLPMIADLDAGAEMAYCERDAGVVDLTEYQRQKDWFLERINSQRER